MSGTASPNGTPVAGAVALVTGGHRGFGRAIVDELLDRGAAKVYATSRSAQTPHDPRIVPLILDVADDASVAAAAKAAPDVSILVNNAGISLATPVLQGTIGRPPRRARDQPLRDHQSCAGVLTGPRSPPQKVPWSTCFRCCRGSRSATAMRSPRPQRGRRRTHCDLRYATRARP